MKLVRKNLVKEMGWKEIENQIELSNQGLHAISYQKIFDSDGSPIYVLIASSKLVKITLDSLNRNEFLYNSPFFRDKFRLFEPFSNDIEKKEIFEVLEIPIEHWDIIYSIEDALNFRKGEITEWVRLAFCLPKKSIFSNMSSILVGTFQEAEKKGIRFLLPIFEKNISFQFINQVNKFGERRLAKPFKDIPILNGITQKINITSIGVINIPRFSQFSKDLTDECLNGIWKEIKKARKNK